MRSSAHQWGPDKTPDKAEYAKQTDKMQTLQLLINKPTALCLINCDLGIKRCLHEKGKRGQGNPNKSLSRLKIKAFSFPDRNKHSYSRQWKQLALTKEQDGGEESSRSSLNHSSDLKPTQSHREWDREIRREKKAGIKTKGEQWIY